VSKTPNKHIMSTLPLHLSSLPCSDACDITVKGDVSGIAVSDTSTDVALTTFVNEAEICVTSIPHRVKNKFHTVDPEADNLLSYLGRPYRFAEGTCSASAASLSSFVVNGNTMIAYVPRFANLNGAYGFRATFCVRVDVASTPFTPGVLKLCYYPSSTLMGTEVASAGGLAWSDSFASTTGVSQLPGVYLDMVESTSVTLRIPWVGPQSYAINTRTTGLVGAHAGVWGTVCLNQYMPCLVGTGTSLPTYAIWTWLEDVECVGALPTVVNVSVPQVGFDVIEREMMNTSQPVSKMLGLATRALKTVNNVPLLSSLASNAMWLTRTLGRTAASFGWSKPRDDSGTRRVYATAYAGESHHTGSTVAISLGASVDNCVMPFALGGTDFDEMSFDYILAHKGAIAKGNLLSTDVSGALKYAANVSPSACFFQLNSANTALSIPQTVATGAAPTVPGSVIEPTSIFWLGQCFRYWRGDLVFTVRMAKTKFHTGRVMLWFLPDIYNTTTIAANKPLMAYPTTTENSYPNMVWDLREGNVVEFVVPYQSPNLLTSFTSSIGNFGMTVVEPLGGPTAVSATVPYIVEVHARNMVFAGPIGPTYAPAPGLQLSAAIYAQSSSEKMNMDVTAFCSGEVFNSVKQMASRASWQVVSAPLDMPLPSNYTFMSPTGTGPYTTTPVASGYMLDYLGTAFVFWRGSINIHTRNIGTSSNGTSIQIGVNPTVPPNIVLGNGCMNSVVSEYNGSCHAALPYYAVNPCSYVRPACGTTYPTSTIYTGDVMPEFVARVDVAARLSTTTEHVGLGAGDDFQFGLYVMPPPLVLPFSGSAGWSGQAGYPV
jgi:hypothetical protein